MEPSKYEHRRTLLLLFVTVTKAFFIQLME